ncbi:phosphatidate cytidylyltransferase [Candidatus Woesearchaeota archaeon]|jgi:phosphatidate cytidylyltransferase|nr:phosphatidate cytidylyltransferase [Candidatus Woesearchaeota archaeon]
MNKDEIIKRILSSIILIPTVLFFIIKGSFLFNFFIFICFLITTYEWLKLSKNNLLKFFGTIFIVISFYAIFKIRNEFDKDYFHLLLVVIICASTDIGGYLFGNIFKGPKLTKISPKKTYSGVIGSFLLSLIFTNLFLDFSSNVKSFEFTKEMFLFILLVSFISQIGDIIVSYFKRKSKIKDTGTIIPGHGGILDRIDGMIFALPFSYVFFLNFNF